MPDFIDYPANDGDIDGIYRYLGWHMAQSGMSSNCFHFLEVLKKRAAVADSLLMAINETVDNNLHLADGENCTLRPLTKALESIA